MSNSKGHDIKKEAFLDFLETLGPKFITGGDFNSKHTVWGSRLTTTKIGKAIHEKNYSPLSTGTPTYWPTDPGIIPDFLDFFITSGISKSYMKLEFNYDLSSDHTPMIATISTTLTTVTKTPKLRTAELTGKNTETYLMTK